MPENIRVILTRCRDFIDTTKVPAYPSGADLSNEIDALLAAQPAPQPSHAAQAVIPADLITIRKPTTSAEMLWLLKLAHLVISDVDKTLEETFAPAQPAAEPSRFGSPELQAMIVARCVEKDQADSVLAIQGETNVQLDTDPNPTAPGQQRDMACSLALGQPVGNGSDQVAGHPSAQGDKLLTVAERNIRSFLRSATFKSESDREAALNCVDVLWEAARAADSVLEDAARLDWLEQNLFHREMDEWDVKLGGRGDQNMWVLFAPKGVQGSARRIIDATRKQGEKQ